MSYGRNQGSYGNRNYGGQQRQQREQRDNDGALFLNDKARGPKDPTFKGRCMVAGRAYWLACWERQDRNGNTMFSLAFTPADEQVQNAPQRPPQQGYGQRQGGYGQGRDPNAPPPQQGSYAQRREYGPPPQDNVPPPSGPEDYNDEVPF